MSASRRWCRVCSTSIPRIAAAPSTRWSGGTSYPDNIRDTRYRSQPRVVGPVQDRSSARQAQEFRNVTTTMVLSWSAEIPLDITVTFTTCLRATTLINGRSPEVLDLPMTPNASSSRPGISTTFSPRDARACLVAANPLGRSEILGCCGPLDGDADTGGPGRHRIEPAAHHVAAALLGQLQLPPTGPFDHRLRHRAASGQDHHRRCGRGRRRRCGCLRRSRGTAPSQERACCQQAKPALSCR